MDICGEILRAGCNQKNENIRSGKQLHWQYNHFMKGLYYFSVTHIFPCTSWRVNVPFSLNPGQCIFTEIKNCVLWILTLFPKMYNLSHQGNQTRKCEWSGLKLFLLTEKWGPSFAWSWSSIPSVYRYRDFLGVFWVIRKTNVTEVVTL